MIWYLSGILSLMAVGLFAYIVHEVKIQGKQEALDETIKKENAMLKKQNEIAAGPADSSSDIIKWLRNDPGQ